MSPELAGIDSEVMTALTVVVTGVLIPLVTALINRPTLPKWARRAIPIALSVVAALFLVVLLAGGPLADQIIQWVFMAATLIGIAQAVYSAMPSVWKEVENQTSPAASGDSID